MVAWGCLGTRLGMGLRPLAFPVQGSQNSPTEGVSEICPSRPAVRNVLTCRSPQTPNTLKYWLVKPDFRERDGEVAKDSGCVTEGLRLR